MAALVEKGSDSGVNLSELTSGELLLINLLRTGYSWDDSEIGSFFIQGLNYRTDNNYTGMRVDLSNVSEMSFEVHNSSGTLVRTYNFTDVSNDTMQHISFSNGSYNAICTQFTTKDGKVHTADNLNY